MNTILQKCLSELSKAEPDVSYIRGMLEALCANQGQFPTAPIIGGIVGGGGVFSTPGGTFSTANAGIPSRSNIDEIKRMAGEA